MTDQRMDLNNLSKGDKQLIAASVAFVEVANAICPGMYPPCPPPAPKARYLVQMRASRGEIRNALSDGVVVIDARESVSGIVRQAVLDAMALGWTVHEVLKVMNTSLPASNDGSTP